MKFKNTSAFTRYISINYTGTGMIPAAPSNKVRLQNRDCVDIYIMNN